MTPAGPRYARHGRKTRSPYHSMRARVNSAPPLLMEPVQASFKLRGADPAQLNVLDVYGVPTGRTVPVASNGVFTLDGRCQTCYYEVRRRTAEWRPLAGHAWHTTPRIRRLAEQDVRPAGVLFESVSVRLERACATEAALLLEKAAAVLHALHTGYTSAAV